MKKEKKATVIYKKTEIVYVEPYVVSYPWGVLPYMAYAGMCRWTGYGFRPLCPKQDISFGTSLS